MAIINKKYYRFISDFISGRKAYYQIKKELKTDGDPKYDLGSYTAIKMRSEANKLIEKNLGKNFVNKNEYLEVTNIHNKLIKKIAIELLGSQNQKQVFGSSTVGSSEAIFLALLAAKWHWKKKNLSGSPNVVFCSNAHLCWEKFARYLEIDIREIPLHKYNEYPKDEIVNAIDVNTIIVVAILGCTYSGIIDPIEKLNSSLEKLNKKNNWDVGIHVDAAIGGFITPYLSNNSLWDFRLNLVRSINLSSHKFGLVYPGLGWVFFKSKEYFNSDLSIQSNYLSGISDSYTINFSKSASLVIAQYYNFLYYGFNGYKEVMESCINNTIYLSNKINQTNMFEVISDGKLPIVVFKFKKQNSIKEEYFTKLLRTKKWMLPYYKLSGELNLTVMRVVVKSDLSQNFIKKLTSDLVWAYKYLDNENNF
jgi:glutamate decarboxylase